MLVLAIGFDKGVLLTHHLYQLCQHRQATRLPVKQRQHACRVGRGVVQCNVAVAGEGEREGEMIY